MNPPSSTLVRVGLAACAVALGWYVGPRVFQASAGAEQEQERDMMPRHEPAKPADTGRGRERAVVGEHSANVRVGFDREELRREADVLAARWPDSTEEARRRAFELAAQDPLAALTFLDSFRARNFEGITSWEREIMLDWARRDHSGMFAGLEGEAKRGGVVPDHWFSIAASIVQNEHPEGLPDMLRWMDEQERSGAGNLTLLAMSKLLAHLTPQTARAIGEFAAQRTDHPAYRDALIQLANAHAHQDPEGALKHVGSFPDAVLRRDTLLAVVAAVTWDKPATIIDWLNTGQLLSGAGLAGLSEPEATELRDEILTTYFTSLVSAHPGYVTQYSSAIANPASREYVQKMAERRSRTDMLSATDYVTRDPGSARQSGIQSEPAPSGASQP